MSALPCAELHRGDPADVGNRQDAIEALDFALRGKVKPQIVVEPLKSLESGMCPAVFELSDPR